MKKDSKDKSIVGLEKALKKEKKETDKINSMNQQLRTSNQQMKASERSLRETKEYLENLITYANAPIIVWDPRFRITRFNGAFESITGRKAAGVIGKSLEFLFPADKVKKSMQLIKKTQKGVKWEIVNIEIIHVNGSVRTLLWNSANILDSNGKTIVATIAQGQDITDLKKNEEALKATIQQLRAQKASNQQLQAIEQQLRAEEQQLKAANQQLQATEQRLRAEIAERKQAAKELKISERKYHDLLDNANDLIQFVSPDGRIQFANKKCLETLGYSDEEVKILKVTDIIKENQIAHIMELFKRAANGETVNNIETIFISKYGKEIYVEGNGNAVRKDGKFIGAIYIFRDITERKRVERQLKESEEKVRTLYDTSSDAIMLLDEKGFFDCNAATLRLFGCASREEFCGRHPADFSPPTQPDGTDSMSYVRNNIAVALKEGSKRFEHLHRRLDGTDFHAEVLLDSMVLCGKKVLQARVYDLTERKRAEEKIRFLSSVVEQSADGMVVTDMEGNLLFVNDTWIRMHGYEKAEELLGQNLNIFHNEEHLKGDIEAFNRKVKEKGYNIGEIGHIRKDNTIFPTLMTTTLLRDENGNPIGLAGVVTDITERKNAELKLRESVKNWRTTYDAIDDIMLVVSKDMTIININQAGIKAFGKSLEEIKDKIKFYELVHNNSCPIDECSIVAALKKKENVANKYCINDSHYESISYPIYDDEREITSFVHVIKDITDKWENEKEKAVLHKQLYQSQKMESIGILAGGIAHDFNNILTAIQGDAELLLEEEAMEDQFKNDLRNIKASVNRAADLVKQLLIFSRKQTVNMKTLELNEVINGMSKMLFRLLGEDIVVKLDLCGEKCCIRADQGNIEQILINLSVNARDSMPKGGSICIKTKRITVYCEDKMKFGDVEPGEYVEFSIEDTGNGMTKEVQKKIFDPFFTTKAVGKGTGLGLSVVFGIIKSHNAGINMYSAPGQGTRFSLYFPTSQDEKTESKKEEGVSDYTGNGEKILMIEDEKIVQKVAKRILEKNNYKVSLAADMKEAEEIYIKEEGDFDLVFSDMILPDGTGLDLVKKLEEIHPIKRVLLSSGYLDDKSRWEEIRQKKIPFIGKPYGMTEIVKKIAEVLK